MLPVPKRVGLVLAASGLIGAVTGLLSPVLQDAVEIAQIQAGTVLYQPTDPIYAYAMRLWSLQDQLPAAMLHWGMSERAVSVLLSVAMTTLAFQAVALTALVAGARPAVASLAPGVVALFGLTRAALSYPVDLDVTHFTWGAIGLAASMLAVALIAAGWRRAGAFALMLLPAVHIVLGAASVALVAAFACAIRPLRRDLWAARWWLVGGTLASAASFAAFLPQVPAVPDADRAAAPQFAAAVLASWDMHRHQTRPPLLPVTLIAIPCVLAAWLVWRRMKGTAAVLPWFVIVTAGVGAALHFAPALTGLSWPTWVLVLMPARLTNFATLTRLAWVLGAAAALTDERQIRIWRPVTAGFVAINLIFVILSAREARDNWRAMAGAGEDAFYSAVAATPGVVLTAPGIEDLQRRTRKPILLNPGWIDAIAYVPETAAGFNRALIAAYGVDLVHPPADSLAGMGSLPLDTGRSLWQARTIAEWQQLQRDWRIGSVVTFDDWALQLPKTAEGDGLTLYAIPEPAPRYGFLPASSR